MKRLVGGREIFSQHKRGRVDGCGEPEPVEVPEDIVRFLARATVAIAGTRDANLVPYAHRASAWLLEPDGRTMTCLFPRMFETDLNRSLEDNGHIAVTVAEMPSHETYQFKGCFVGSRPATEDDMVVFRTCQARFVERCLEVFGFSPEISRPFLPPPRLAVTFRIREIFDQTPGPEAGRRVAPVE